MANRTRNKQISFRLTENEYKAVMKKIEKAGMSQQEYFLKTLNSATIYNTDGLKEVVPELKRVGNNLNQIAKRYNEGAAVPQGEWNELVGGYNEIWQLLKQLIAELQSAKQ